MCKFYVVIINLSLVSVLFLVGTTCIVGRRIVYIGFTLSLGLREGGLGGV